MTFIALHFLNNNIIDHALNRCFLLEWFRMNLIKNNPNDWMNEFILNLSITHLKNKFKQTTFLWIF